MRSTTLRFGILCLWISGNVTAVALGIGYCPPEVNFPPGPVGPDLTAFSLQALDSYGSGFPASAPNGIAAFAVGTTACNIGDTPVSWYDGGSCMFEARRNRHPIITSGMHRLANGRFEQIGMSWVAHGFFAVNQNACGQCEDPIPGDPDAGYFLGVNCSNPHSAQLNGAQTLLGPRSQINAFSGQFPFPPSLPPAQGTRIERRLQVHHEDLDPNVYPNALFFVEGAFVAADDAASGNGQNNFSYRKINMIVPDPDTTNPSCPLHHPQSPVPNIVYYCAIPAAPTQRDQPAIRAWKDSDPSVTETDIPTPEDAASANTGLMILAAKAAPLGNGFFRYEYALENVNSDRSVRSFQVPISRGVTIENVGFHDVSYHSGNAAIENYDGQDWTPTIASNSVRWETLPFDAAPNANALRWGTLYNFRFDANSAPISASVTIGLFKPAVGLPDVVTAQTIAPRRTVLPIPIQSRSGRK